MLTRNLGFISRKYSTKLNSSTFTYKKFYKNITFKEGTNDDMKNYYKEKWYYPLTKYPTNYYTFEQDYLKKDSNKGLFKWAKYQFKTNAIIFKVLLENYKNTAWYIYKFRVLGSYFGKSDIGYNMNDLLKNTIFKVIEEENKLTIIPKQNTDTSDVKQIYTTPGQTLKNLQNDEFFYLKDLNYNKFLPFHQDKDLHGVVYDFCKISFIILLFEELSLILLKMNYLRPPFFVHIPDTLIKHIDDVMYPNHQKLKALEAENKNEVAYVNPYTCKDPELKSKYSVDYMNLVYLDDLIFINRLITQKDDFYRDELIYKCMNRNLFPKEYIKGSYLTLSTDTFKNLSVSYLDKRYSETLMNSKNGIHNMHDLS